MTHSIEIRIKAIGDALQRNGDLLQTISAQLETLLQRTEKRCGPAIWVSAEKTTSNKVGAMTRGIISASHNPETEKRPSITFGVIESLSFKTANLQGTPSLNILGSTLNESSAVDTMEDVTEKNKGTKMNFGRSNFPTSALVSDFCNPKTECPKSGNVIDESLHFDTLGSSLGVSTLSLHANRNSCVSARMEKARVAEKWVLSPRARLPIAWIASTATWTWGKGAKLPCHCATKALAIQDSSSCNM